MSCSTASCSGPDGIAAPERHADDRCPEGDVTGEELAVCTVWQGVIYTSDTGQSSSSAGRRRGRAERLILPDLGPSLRLSAAYGANGFRVPWDVFALKGCQE